MITKQLTGRKGTSASYLIFDNNNHHKLGNIVWNIDKKEWLTLQNIATFTIIPNPADATVTILSEGNTQDGNEMIVTTGATVYYAIEKNGYEPKYGEVVVNENITIDGTLREYVTITLEPTPSNAEVTLKYIE